MDKCPKMHKGMAFYYNFEIYGLLFSVLDWQIQKELPSIASWNGKQGIITAEKQECYNREVRLSLHDILALNHITWQPFKQNK